MTRRIVGVEMEVWTEREVREAVHDGLLDAVAASLVSPWVCGKLVAHVMARLKGERT